MNEYKEGKISFINHQKKYALIEYGHSGKKKSIKGDIGDEVIVSKGQSGIRNNHKFIIGDVIKFKIKISDRGEQMKAVGIQFMYNTSMDALLNKARAENKFLGYLKIVDDKYFIKEVDTYLFFPVFFSSWQILPEANELHEPVTFFLENLDKKEKITASLFANSYIPEFYTAVKLFKNRSTIEAEVYKVTSHGVYINLINNKIQAKIDHADVNSNTNNQLQPGNKVKVIISYLSKSRIVVKAIQ